MEIFNKSYTGDCIDDISRDIYESLNPEFNDNAKHIETDEYNIPTGKFIVTIDYIK